LPSLKWSKVFETRYGMSQAVCPSKATCVAAGATDTKAVIFRSPTKANPQWLTTVMAASEFAWSVACATASACVVGATGHIFVTRDVAAVKPTWLGLKTPQQILSVTCPSAKSAWR
jgi:hypothetical protein